MDKPKIRTNFNRETNSKSVDNFVRHEIDDFLNIEQRAQNHILWKLGASKIRLKLDEEKINSFNDDLMNKINVIQNKKINILTQNKRKNSDIWKRIKSELIQIRRLKLHKMAKKWLKVGSFMEYVNKFKQNKLEPKQKLQKQPHLILKNSSNVKAI